MGGAKKDSHLSLAKITQPQVEGVLERKELFRRLDATRKKPLTWIEGPGGSGKTTLVSSYLKTRGLNCLWFQIDPGDADLATFFYYLAMAGKKASPRQKKPLPLLTPEYLHGVHEFSRNFFGDLFSRLKPPCVIVFDNYQEVPAESELHEAILQGLSRLLDGITIVMVSRSDPPPAFSRYRMNRELESIGWEDLRLSFEECKEILFINKTLKISEADLRELYQLIDGWAAGLQLLAGIGVVQKNPACGTAEGTREEVFDYFACEVFERQNLATKEFLLKVSLLPHMTEGMAQDLTGDPAAGGILADLNRHNHFTEKRRQPDISYQFHPLFREFLLKKAREFYGGEELINLKKTAAFVLQGSGQPEAAIDLLHEAGEWGALTRLIVSQAETMVQQGRNLVLESWINMLPERLLNDEPWLIFWSAVARLPFDPLASKALFENAFNRFVRNDDRVGLFLAWAGVSDSIFFCFTGFHDYDRWLDVFERIREEYGHYPTPEIEVRMTASVLNALVFRQPFHKEYESCIDRASALVETEIDLAVKIQLHHTLCVSQIFARDFIRGELFINAFRSFTENNPVPPMALILQRQSEAFYLWLVARFDECRAVVADSLRIGSECGIHLFDDFLTAYVISAALSEEDLEGAEPHFDTMFSRLDRMNDWARSYFFVLLTWRDLLNGDLERARRGCIKSGEVADKVGMPTTFCIHLNWRAVIEHHLDNHEIYDTLLAEVVAYYDRIGIESNKFDLYLNKAYIDLERGREAEGLRALGDCFFVARKYGHVNTYYWQAEKMSMLCARALEEGIETDYVRHLIRLRGLVPGVPLGLSVDWPWECKIHTLGRFNILRDDKPVKTGGRVQKRPMEMLKVIIALGGRQVMEESITDILWPDAAGDDAHNAFTTTLSRLRKILGKDGAIELSEGRVTLMQNVCWVDTWVFERLIGDADNAWKNGDRDRARMISEQAFVLYSGAFLSGDDEFWNISTREKLKSKFLRNVSALGKYYEENDMWNEALESYTKGLEVDELVEEFYKRAMICCMNLDRKSEALSIFKRCKDALGRVLDIEPSEDTLALAKQLRS